MPSPAAAPPPPSNLPRIVAASLSGTTIEWYDLACLAGGSVDPVTQAVIQYSLDCNQNKYSRALRFCAR